MAELNASNISNKGNARVKKGRRLSTRIDLTPMVDLGFLLITFFIFTTAMSKPTAKKLFLPKDTDEDHKNEVPRSAVLTLMPGKNDRVYYYEGDDPTSIKTSDIKAIRDVILDKKRRTDSADFEVILKPSRDATYGNAVGILDEMTIDAIQHYAFVDMSPYEYSLIQTKD